MEKRAGKKPQRTRRMWVGMWLVLSLLPLWALGCNCAGGPGVSSGCEICPDPERCVKEGSKIECVACVTDKHCQDTAGSTKKCLTNAEATGIVRKDNAVQEIAVVWSV